LDIPTWEGQLEKAIGENSTRTIIAILYFGYLTSTILWIVFSFLFVIFAYGTILGRHWVWSTGIIITSIFLVVFSLMVASFMITTWIFPTRFSIEGLITVVLSMLIDIGLIFYLTRPGMKLYFEISERVKNKDEIPESTSREIT
jgi:hypothetical protein